MTINREQLDKWFGSNTLPQEANDAPCQDMRLAAKRFAESIVDNTPASADQSSAIRNVRQALHWAVGSLLFEKK